MRTPIGDRLQPELRTSSAFRQRAPAAAPPDHAERVGGRRLDDVTVAVLLHPPPTG